MLGKNCPLGFPFVLCFILCRLICICSFPVRCLGQDVEFDCIGS